MSVYGTFDSSYLMLDQLSSDESFENPFRGSLLLLPKECVNKVKQLRMDRSHHKLSEEAAKTANLRSGLCAILIYFCAMIRLADDPSTIMVGVLRFYQNARSIMEVLTRAMLMSKSASVSIEI